MIACPAEQFAELAALVKRWRDEEPERVRLAREEGYRAGLAAGRAQVAPEPLNKPVGPSTTFICDLCEPPRSFASPAALGGHKSIHSKPPRSAADPVVPAYGCRARDCTERFTTKARRLEHEGVVHGLRPWSTATPGPAPTEPRPAPPAKPEGWKSRFCHSGAHRRCTLFADRCTCSCHTEL